MRNSILFVTFICIFTENSLEMHILLVAATQIEIKPFLDSKQIKELQNNFYQVNLPNHTLDILVTGVGMVATAFALGCRLNAFKYDLAINAGIAGSFIKHIPIGSVVNVINETFSEIGAEEEHSFLLPLEIGLKEFNKDPFENGNLRNQLTIQSPLLRKLPQVKGITVNTINGNPKRIELINELFHPDIETMEGAAFFYACTLSKIPFVQIRSISNYVEARNKAKWEIGNAIQSLNQFIISFFNEI